MASPSVTYTFANSTTADATQVNTNFQNLISGATDGTKDYSIAALTLAGTLTVGGAAAFSGNVTLGNASGDDITVTGSLASSIPLKTTFSYDLGSATVGLKSVYLGSDDSAARSVRVIAGAVATSYTVTLPIAPPAATAVVTMTSTGVMATDYNFVPTGAVLPFAGTAAPTGFLACDGSAVSRTTYAALFTVIAETHGQGDNSTTFNVPDYRGRFLRGIDGAAGRDPDAASRSAMGTGGASANNVGSVQDDQMINHTHTFAYTTSGTNAVGNPYSSNGAQAGSYTTSNPSVGGSETRPKNAYVLYIIKT